MDPIAVALAMVAFPRLLEEAASTPAVPLRDRRSDELRGLLERVRYEFQRVIRIHQANPPMLRDVRWGYYGAEDRLLFSAEFYGAGARRWNVDARELSTADLHHARFDRRCHELYRELLDQLRGDREAEERHRRLMQFMATLPQYDPGPLEAREQIDVLFGSLAVRPEWVVQAGPDPRTVTAEYAQAADRGLKLLKEWLSPAQLAQYEKHQHFEVIGSDTRKRYRIRHGVSMNIDELDREGGKVAGWCFVPQGGLVAGDVMLAQKVALETNERGAMKVANLIDGHRTGGRRGLWLHGDWGQAEPLVREPTAAEPEPRSRPGRIVVDSRSWTG